MADPRMIDPGPSTRGWHHLQDILLCPERYRLREEVRAWDDEPDKAPFVKGELFHLGTAHSYKRTQLRRRKGGNPNDFYPPDTAIDRKVQTEEGPMWQEFAGLIKDAHAAYIRHWTQDNALDPHWEIIGVECEYKVRVWDELRQCHYLYTQRADLVVRDLSTKKIWIVDHKTTAKITKRVTARYTLSGQFLGYRLLGQTFYKKEFGGVLLNMVELGGDKGFAFARLKLPPTPATSPDRLRLTIIHGERTLTDMKERFAPGQPWPQTLNCWGPYGACPMFDICQWGAP